MPTSNNEAEHDFPRGAGGPATRALIAAGYTRLDQLTAVTEASLLQLHGMGPKALGVLRSALEARGLSFAEASADHQPTTVDEYIAQHPAEVRRILEQLRAVIKQAAPEATEKLSYGVPTLYLNGNLVSFGAAQRHIGFYPTPAAIKAFQAELAAYKSSKGAVQFPLDKPIPYDLIAEIVKFRLAANTKNQSAS